MEQLFHQIQSLIDKKQQASPLYSVENELAPLVKKLFRQRKKRFEANYQTAILVLKNIIAMNKGTGAFGFYEMLERSNLSFSEELLRYAVDTEPYYNNNDTVLVYYLSVISKKTSLEKIVAKFREKVGPGHFTFYQNVFSEMMSLRSRYDFPIPTQKMRKEISTILEHSTSFQTQRKAIAFALLFKIKEVIPLVEKIRTETGKKFATLLTDHPSRDLDLMVTSGDFTALTLALYHFNVSA
jgi:hypothetical protein